MTIQTVIARDAYGVALKRSVLKIEGGFALLSEGEGGFQAAVWFPTEDLFEWDEAIFRRLKTSSGSQRDWGKHAFPAAAKNR